MNKEQIIEVYQMVASARHFSNDFIQMQINKMKSSNTKDERKILSGLCRYCINNPI